MTDRKEILREALRCCREENGCENCPVLGEICDQLFVAMVEVPEQLLDMIDEALDEEQNDFELCDRCGRRRLRSNRQLGNKQ